MWRKRLMTGALLTTLTALAILFAWMLWPRPLSAVLDGNQTVCMSVLTDSVETDEEAHIARPNQEMEYYDVPPGSPEGAAINEILSRYSYHYCWDTLTGKTSIDHSGSEGVSVFLWEADTPRRELDVFGVSRCFIGEISGSGTRICRIGYFGDGRARALTRELAEVFQGK